jgi:hypothetical protein
MVSWQERVPVRRVAAIMGRGALALGCGDADLFARAAGTDYFAETPVGGLPLGSQRDGATGPVRWSGQVLSGGLRR